jgi:CrcB protein
MTFGEYWVSATWLVVLGGGAIGSLARHGVNVAAARLFGGPVPYATAAVNLAGSLAVGALAGALAGQRLAMSPTMRTFVFVGILGGFTTFSTFMLDSLTLLEKGSVTATMVNLFGQLLVGFLLVWVGFRLGLRT